MVVLRSFYLALSLLGLLSVCENAVAQQPKEISNSIGMKLVLVPNGTFQMGSPPSEKNSRDDERQHKVTITKDYYIGMFEVTQAQYLKVMQTNPSFFQGDRIATKIPAKKHPVTGRTIEDAQLISEDNSRYPVDTVSRADALAFCKRLTEMPAEKAAGRLYRLPTEAEWEYACRAGSKTAYAFGDFPDLSGLPINNQFATGRLFLKKVGEYAWFNENSDQQTHQVGKKKPNAWGLYDMYGNVREWCSDSYREYPNGAAVDPVGPDYGDAFGDDGVRRGGDFSDGYSELRSSTRHRTSAGGKSSGFGFRVVMIDSAVSNKSVQPESTVPSNQGTTPARPAFKTTPSGLKYRILKSGSGSKLNANSRVLLHYRGWLDDGRSFDSSYDRGEPLIIRVSDKNLLPGWLEGLKLVAIGDKVEFEIPPHLGYGSNGSGFYKPPIPPDATLHYQIEILEMR